MSITSILLCLSGGYLLKKIFNLEKLFEVLGIITNDILLTLFVFGSVASKKLDYLISLRLIFLAVGLVLIANLVSSYFYKKLFLKNDREWATALMVLAVFPNSAALGYPLVSLFVNDLAPAVIFSQINFMVVLPLSVFILNSHREGDKAIKIGLIRTVSTPSVLANFLALLVVITGLSMPEKVLSSFVFIGKWSLPLMLVYFGSRLSFRHLSWRRLLETGVLRMLVPAVLVFFTFRSTPRDIFYTLLIESSMPPAIVAGSLLARYRLKAEEAVSVSFLLTILAIAGFVMLKFFLN